jgi:hypothetical protein
LKRICEYFWQQFLFAGYFRLAFIIFLDASDYKFFANRRKLTESENVMPEDNKLGVRNSYTSKWYRFRLCVESTTDMPRIAAIHENKAL